MLTQWLLSYQYPIQHSIEHDPILVRVFHKRSNNNLLKVLFSGKNVQQPTYQIGQKVRWEVGSIPLRYIERITRWNHRCQQTRCCKYKKKWILQKVFLFGKYSIILTGMLYSFFIVNNIYLTKFGVSSYTWKDF